MLTCSQTQVFPKMCQIAQNSKPIINHSHRRQYLTCGILCLGGFLAGTGQGWSSPALPSLKQSGHFPELKTSDFSWIASITLLGAFVGSPTGGVSIRILGRKNTLLISAVPYLIGFALLAFPFQVWMLYAGRFLLGLGLGLMILAGSVYMSEISEPELRGILSVLWFVAIRLGILFEYGIGSLLPYNHLSLISVVLSVAFGFSIILLPKSPRWLMTKYRKQEAIDSLCWLRACNKSSPSLKVLTEVQEIEEAVLRAEKDKMGAIAFISTYFTNRTVLKAVLVASLLMFAKEGCAGNVFSFYVVQIFQKTGSALDSHVSGVVIGVAQLLGILLTTYYVDRVGRRILLFISFVIMSFSLILVGLYCQFKSEMVETIRNSGWIPLAIFVIYHAAFSGGPFVLTYTITSEIIPTNVIASVSGLVTSFAWISAFLLARYYEDLNYGIGVAPTFWVFAGLSAAGAICIQLLVPETVGRSLENIHREKNTNCTVDNDSTKNCNIP